MSPPRTSEKCEIGILYHVVGGWKYVNDPYQFVIDFGNFFWRFFLNFIHFLGLFLGTVVNEPKMKKIVSGICFTFWVHEMYIFWPQMNWPGLSGSFLNRPGLINMN